MSRKNLFFLGGDIKQDQIIWLMFVLFDFQDHKNGNNGQF